MSGIELCRRVLFLSLFLRQCRCIRRQVLLNCGVDVSDRHATLGLLPQHAVWSARVPDEAFPVCILNAAQWLTFCVRHSQHIIPPLISLMYGLRISFQLLARDVIYTSRAYATMSVSVCLSVCL